MDKNPQPQVGSFECLLCIQYTPVSEWQKSISFKLFNNKEYQQHDQTASQHIIYI